MSFKKKPILIPDTLGEELHDHLPKSRVELHIHLDGAIRHETIWELLKSKNIPLPGNGSLTALKRDLSVRKPKDLMHFLDGFKTFFPIYIGNLRVIERIALEFCEDEAGHGVAYVEARFSPHLMLCPKAPEVTTQDIIKAVLAGFKEGETKYSIKARLILCCMRGRPDECIEVLRLCEMFRNEGVVGMDIAGDEASICESGSVEQEIAAFSEAKKLGIHRTVHAGEAAPAKSVEEALDKLHAERIGHGYRVLEDETLYKRCLKENVHFECCPHSSIFTGSVSLEHVVKHPVIQFAIDDANFSINSDDPTITNTYLPEEYDIVQSWGLTEAHLTRANFNAAKASFLPDDEKRTLIKDLRKAYGVIDG
ncbi:adenosine deaminase-like [Tigriopus californicus]|uniref:adenosine deaminase-like n=1 Tax=Tigriopus californicus TaxID=6832 RepID=UPI0027D9FD37|nr:adenosine deaminase-like [Tigriopus californicus]